MPVGLISSFWRFKYESEFEKMNAAVFAESSKFAAESIGAFRTVPALTLEGFINNRYDILLKSHVNSAFKIARWTSLIFAFTDSVSLGCQGLIFWYGGRLLASRELNMDDAYFKYPTRNVSVFEGYNITIEKGQFAAFVGPSGCGKTSITSLLERFYDLDKGTILCNGANIYDLNLHEYRKNISLVAQEPTMFQGTIRDNILLGVDPENITDEILHKVCRDAAIHDFIASLPDGYNTDIGSKGFSLSGGQKQRVTIARALIRNPKILLLDEATSSLNSESEKLVQAAFERAGKGRTMLVVAHRLATVQNADVIHVLGEGRVLEKGNHQELLKQKGVYWNMCQSQALDR
ncbi:hypothetical protein EsH8_VIII_001089 [Colletotrichum jinshuiense]